MNFAQDALHVLGSVAPTLATAVAGPFGGMAVSAIESALGFKETQTKSPVDRQKAIETALLGGDPQTLLAIKKADNDFTVEMEKVGIQKEQLVLADKDSARRREEVVKDKTPSILAYVTTIGFFGALAALFFVSPPEGSKSLVYTLLGSLGTVWITQMSYYYGSSTGEERKSAALVEIAKS